MPNQEHIPNIFNILTLKTYSNTSNTFYLYFYISNYNSYLPDLSPWALSVYIWFGATIFSINNTDTRIFISFSESVSLELFALITVSYQVPSTPYSMGPPRVPHHAIYWQPLQQKAISQRSLDSGYGSISHSATQFFRAENNAMEKSLLSENRHSRYSC